MTIAIPIWKVLLYFLILPPDKLTIKFNDKLTLQRKEIVVEEREMMGLLIISRPAFEGNNNYYNIFYLVMCKKTQLRGYYCFNIPLLHSSPFYILQLLIPLTL